MNIVVSYSPQKVLTSMQLGSNRRIEQQSTAKHGMENQTMAQTKLKKESDQELTISYSPESQILNTESYDENNLQQSCYSTVKLPSNSNQHNLQPNPDPLLVSPISQTSQDQLLISPACDQETGNIVTPENPTSLLPSSQNQCDPSKGNDSTIDNPSSVSSSTSDSEPTRIKRTELTEKEKIWIAGLCAKFGGNKAAQIINDYFGKVNALKPILPRQPRSNIQSINILPKKK